jgi:eukaryotic-like serine/threonine-protein kinase
VLLGRYRLIEPLGRGGMGTVWRAHDTRLGREVAVKELRLPDDLDTEQRATWTARLDREARAAARLRHPGIVTVYDLVTGDDGQPWIIMELVPGPSLAGLLAEQGPVPPGRAAALGVRILDALSAAHQAGIIHRDIKPANVLLEGDRVLLTDFGIAVVEGEANLTHSGALLGSPAFMAPEQVRGQTATAASDLWALGATLYTAVEGHPPFDGASTGAVLVAVATEDPAPMTNAGPLTPVIHALLRKDPTQRPTANDLHTMLTRFTPALSRPAPATAAEPPPLVSGVPFARLVPGPFPPGPRPAPTSLRRRPAVLIAAVLIVAGIVAMLTYALQDRKNAAYEANKRYAAALGAPLAGFTLKDEHRFGSNGVRRTYSGCLMSCGQPASASALLSQCRYVGDWLKTLPSVSVVSPPYVSHDGMSCTILVKPAINPKIFGVRIEVIQNPGDFLLQLEVG